MYSSVSSAFAFASASPSIPPFPVSSSSSSSSSSLSSPPSSSALNSKLLLAQINGLVKKISYNEMELMNPKDAQLLSSLLETHFDDIDIIINRNLQRGNCAVDLVTSGATLLVSKEHLHHESCEWIVPFNVLNDITFSLFLHTYYPQSKYFPEVVHIKMTPSLTRIVTKFVPLPFQDIFCARPSKTFVKERMRELIEAVHFLHTHGFAHRDIKPDNIRLRADGSLVLLDFDTACRRTDHRWSTKPTCTITTRPPELMNIDQKQYDGRACDIFSAGCVIFAMINDGQLPFGTCDDRLQNIRSFTLPLKLIGRIGTSGAAILKSMLAENPSSRPTAKQLLDENFFNK